MFLNTLPKNTLSALKKLDAIAFCQKTNTYLAGGTALSIHLGHRLSLDLDFFSATEPNLDILIKNISTAGKFQTEKREEGILLGIFENIKFSHLYFPYSNIQPFSKILTGTNIASIADITAMKVSAVCQRGTKRDFVDLFFIAKNLSLEQMLSLYHQKFKNAASENVHVLKSLIYFADAEDEPMPQMLTPASWEEIKSFFREKIKIFTKEFNGQT